MTNSKHISSETIPIGLSIAEREEIARFLAQFDEYEYLKVVLDKLRNNFLTKTYKKIERQIVSQETIDEKNRFVDQLFENIDKSEEYADYQRRVENTAKRILQSNATTTTLRLWLWAHIRKGLDLGPKIAVTPRALHESSVDIANKICLAVEKESTDAEPADKKVKRYIQKTAAILKKTQSLDQFSRKAVNFDEALYHIAIHSFVQGSKTSFEELSEEDQDTFISELQKQLRDVPKATLESQGITDISKDALRKTLLTSGGFLALMTAVNQAGFAAYIMAAKLSSIVPFVGGKTLVTSLAFIINPLFWVPAVFIGGAYAIRKHQQDSKHQLSVYVSALLALRGINKTTQRFSAAEQASRMFWDTHRSFQDEVFKGIIQEPPDAEQYKEIGQYVPKEVVALTDLPITTSTMSILQQPLEDMNQKDYLKTVLFSKDDETLLLAGFVFADLLFDVAAIDPKVLEAADFSHSADLSGPFDFAHFAETISGLSLASRVGHESQLMGYTAEQIVAARLTNEGFIVEFPDKANQPGYDLLIERSPFQVKCLQPESYPILQEHFEKYPDIPVVANTEIVDVVRERAPEWDQMVFSLDGYTYVHANDLTTASLAAGADVGEYPILPFIAGIAGVKNIMGWWAGNQTASDAVFGTGMETGSKMALGVVGSVIGKGIGGVLGGPAGAYILGGLLTVVGSTQGYRLSNFIDSKLEPERARDLQNAALVLLKKCVGQLKIKLQHINSIIQALPSNDYAAAVGIRWRWESAFVEGKIIEGERLILDEKSKGKEYAMTALEFSNTCKIYPYHFHSEYKDITAILEKKSDRFKIVRDLWRKK